MEDANHEQSSRDAALLTAKLNEALEQLRRTLEMAPNFFSARALAAYVYAKFGKKDEAFAEFDRLVTLRSDRRYLDVYRALPTRTSATPTLRATIWLTQKMTPIPDSWGLFTRHSGTPTKRSHISTERSMKKSWAH